MSKYILIILALCFFKVEPLAAQKLDGGFKDADETNKFRAIDFNKQFISDVIEYKGKLLAFGKGTIYSYNPVDEKINVLIDGIKADVGEVSSGEFVGVYSMMVNEKPSDVVVYNLYDKNRVALGAGYALLSDLVPNSFNNQGEILEFIPEGQGYYVEKVNEKTMLSTGGIGESKYNEVREIFSFRKFKHGAISTNVLFFVDYKTSDFKTSILYKITMGDSPTNASGITELFSHDLAIFNDAAVFVSAAKDLTTATGEKGETVKVIEAGIGMKNHFTFGDDFFCTFIPGDQQIYVFDPKFELQKKVSDLGPDGLFLKNGLNNVLNLTPNLVALETKNLEVLLFDSDLNQRNENNIVKSNFPLLNVDLVDKLAFLSTRSLTNPVEEVSVVDIANGTTNLQFKLEIPIEDYSVHNTYANSTSGIYLAAANKDNGFEVFIENEKGFQVAEEIFNTDYEQAILEQLEVTEVLPEYSTYPKRILNLNGTIYSLSRLQMPDAYTDADAQAAGINTAVRDMNFLYKLNKRPGNPSPASFSVDENEAKGTVLGTISATDQDDDNLSFQLVSGTGSSDNSKVTLSGSQLSLVEVPDYEADTLWAIRVQVTDPHGDSRSRAITININDVNDAPTGLDLTTEYVSESLPIGDPVAGIETVDEDETDNFTYSLVVSNTNPGVADADNLSFSISDSVLVSNTTFDAALKSQYSITLEVSDKGGATYQQAFVINITEENEVPTDILLDNNSIAENLTERTLVGTLDTEDADADEDNDDTDDVDFTYALVSGNGDGDNSSFEISADSLFAINSFDFEANSSLSIRVQTTDPKMATFSKVLGISVTDANDPPIGIILSSDSIDENQSNETVVGTLDGEDPDETEDFSFSLIDETNFPDNTAFSINTNNELVQSVDEFDFESQSIYEIKLQLTDKEGETIDSVFTIHVVDVNDAPADITLSGNSVNEESSNAIAGQLSAVDEDATDNHTFHLPKDSLSNDKFQILTGDELALAAPLNFEVDDKFYEIYVEVSDISGAVYGKTFEIELLDINDPVDTLVMKRTSVKGGLSFEEKVSNIELRDEDLGNNISNFYSREDYVMSLVDNANFPDNSNFQITFLNEDGLYALEAATDLTFDEAADNLYEIKIEVVNIDLSYVQTFKIELVSESANTPPTNINISNDSVFNVATAGTEIGVLSTEDDAADTHTYSLASNSSSNDNELFSIATDRLILDANLKDSTEESFVVVVISEDNGGLSLTEEITIYVKEFEDSTPPEITGVTGGDRSVQEDDNSYEISGSVTDDIFIESVELEYGPVTSIEFTKKDLIELDGGQFTGSIPFEQGDAFGLKARIIAVDTSGNSTASDTVYFYKEITSSSALATLPKENIGKGKKSADYRMFSVPYNIQSQNQSIRDIFETSLGETYSDGNFKVYHWDPEKESYEEFLSLGTIEPGLAYWFSTTLEDPIINFGGGNVYPYKVGDKAVWKLKAGWNQIGNPYPVSIDWNLIQSTYPTIGDLYMFGSEGYTTEATLAPHQGAFILVQEDINIEADVTNNLGGRQASLASETESSLELAFKLTQGELHAEGGVAMHKEASDGLDGLDQANPPALGNHVEISFKQPESIWDNYRWDVVREKDYHVWSFTVNVQNKDQFSSLSWEANDFLKGQFYLIDLEGLQKIDLTEHSEYQFRGGNQHQFKLIYDRFSTGRFDLGTSMIGAPYPNPFKSDLFIPVNISDQRNANIMIEVMDLNGKLVAKKSWNRELKAGYQLLSFDGANQNAENGTSFSNGVYLYQLTITENNSTIKKMGRIIKY
ncbi:cadherin domain-containing protein [Marivirga salinae]|uniref:Cadherin domain-containing protein n=1 Tax=Marivirga salinarum TaxID=3059078 RepID=A0AA51NA91_9BACT|nr:cadherin domain-containing protein [Marivirga sp. BDSF4-3]WMN11547.1 cadherin domain-containing protein [Marivirga sp. BDSF4-3]